VSGPFATAIPTTPQRGTHCGQRRFAVVGGGVTGIATTYYLRRLGHEAELIEQASVIGGRSRPEKLGARHITLGGKNIGRHYRLFREFTATMGDHRYEHFGINASRVQGGKLRTLDRTRPRSGLLRFVSGASARDLGVFLYLCSRVRVNEDNRFLGSRYFQSLSECHDHRPLSAYFGPGLLKAVIRPMTIRMNGAEPDECYLGNFGTNLGMLLDSYDQLSMDMNDLFKQFEELGPVWLNTRAEELLITDGAVTGLKLHRGEKHEVRHYEGVVLATPAPAAAQLVRPHLPSLADSLDQVRYSPAAVIVAEYDRPVFDMDVRALLFDDAQPLSNAGAYGMHERHVVRYTFSGRVARCYLGLDADMETLLTSAEHQLDQHMPVSANRRRGYVARQWSCGYCAYLPYHGRFLRKVYKDVSSVYGLFLAGDYLRGASLEACFRSARDCVTGIAS
jgi:protoporphyrinogen/coproporphyrinogen III oxidase